MSDAAKRYLDLYAGLLEGLTESEDHSEFASKLDDLAALERQRAEVAQEYLAELQQAIGLDPRVVQAMVEPMEDGNAQGAFEAASKRFRQLYEPILDAEENGVAPLEMQQRA